ncbi:hypothetical protein DWW36_15050 [Erysipelotrichaceae bacterium AF15-26LB]|nr:hypothetical protein HMPREF0983_01873 [Erysipelotrichaceae bacterium 3_1_53]MCR0349450.1 hypothetical protein [[Clostridium] innocuum]RJV85354.1 hypothetical protein DWW36_15050 [Erysipelotrichaceae bacterium AF15-26LB]RJV86564.1 hypothetical protein DWX45_15335 [Erysipelotrichaceae bacterium AF19-24AC]
MRNEKRGIQIGLGASSIFMIFVVLCMMILSVLSYTRALQNEKIAQREKLYQEAYARSDTGAQLLVNEMRQHADLRLEQLLKLEQVEKLLEEYHMETKCSQAELLVNIPVQEDQQLQLRLQKQNKSLLIRAWKTITKGDASDGND